MELISTLKEIIKNCNTIDDYLSSFEKFSEIKSPDNEEIFLFESGNYDFTGEKEFYFSLVRQYKTDEDADEYTQIHLDIIFEPIENIQNRTIWSDEFENKSEFFNSIKQSEVYQFIKQNQVTIKRVDVYIDQT